MPHAHSFDGTALELMRLRLQVQLLCTPCPFQGCVLASKASGWVTLGGETG